MSATTGHTSPPAQTAADDTEARDRSSSVVARIHVVDGEPLDLDALCPNGCPHMECYCPDGTEPRRCGHGPGGTCDAGHCLDCDACFCGEDW